MIRTYSRPIRKRPRQKAPKFQAIVSKMNKDVCDDCGHICSACMEAYAAEAEYNRPGHAWAVENGKVIYLEDVVMSHHLGRNLKPTEGVLHKNGNCLDNRLENLELIIIPDMDEK